MKTMRFNFSGTVGAMLAAAVLLAACNSGSSSSLVSPTPTAPAPACDAGSSDTSGCGQLALSLTDADGDFLSYTVTVKSLTLTRKDGAIVDALPNAVQVDFVQYADLREFVSLANVPPGTYTKGTITLDYTTADIEVEQNGLAVKATPLNPDGTALTTAILKISLDGHGPLTIERGVPSLLSLDFNLEASNTVDLTATPPTVTVEPLLVADVDVPASKDMRVRGPLVKVNSGDSDYRVALRPFHLRDGAFGDVTVYTTATTTFEINGQNYVGADGLTALAAAGATTATRATGSYDVETHTYTATDVAVGSDVPGGTDDVVEGTVIARDPAAPNVLTVRGATLIRAEHSAVFAGEVTVTVGPDTVVREPGSTDTFDASDVSVGQRVTLFGTLTDTDAGALALDATEGHIRMRYSRVAATLNSIDAGTMAVTVYSINGLPPAWFNFAGTGTSAGVDADPASYSVALNGLDETHLATGDPVRILGLVAPYGTAPDDFDAHSVADFANASARIVADWSNDGATAPFSVMNSDGLALDLGNPNLGTRHYLRRGGVRSDLANLPSSPMIVPGAGGLGTFAIRQDGAVQIYIDFASFEADLTNRLNGSTTMTGFFAQGGFNAENNTLTATVIAVNLR